MNPILGVGLAVAAFCAVLFLEPMPAGHEGCSIDTFSRPWYNVATGKYLVGSVDSDVGRLPALGSLVLVLDTELWPVDRRPYWKEVCLTEKHAKGVLHVLHSF